MAQLKDLLVSGAARLVNGALINNTSSTDNINPNANNTYSLGTSSLKWQNVYATTFNGNATSADQVNKSLTFGDSSTPTYTFNGSTAVNIPIYTGAYTKTT